MNRSEMIFVARRLIVDFDIIFCGFVIAHAPPPRARSRELWFQLWQEHWLCYVRTPTEQYVIDSLNTFRPDTWSHLPQALQDDRDSVCAHTCVFFAAHLLVGASLRTILKTYALSAHTPVHNRACFVHYCAV